MHLISYNEFSSAFRYDVTHLRAGISVTGYRKRISIRAQVLSSISFQVLGFNTNSTLDEELSRSNR